MNQSFRTAIDVYEEALATIAQRADPRFQAELSPLQSILGHLFAHQSGQTFSGFYRPQVMHDNAALPVLERPENLGESYRSLWQQLEQEQANRLVDGQDLTIREANLHAMLQRYGWAVPAPEAEDVSLYDHARTKAAVAVCLQDNAASDQQAALLLGADLSGVQNWLYTFSSSGAAKSLRGRSFYIQLLMEVIAFYVLEQLQLPMSNLLYVGGGNFYLLAPVRLGVRIPQLRREISNKLRKMHRGDLYVALDAVHVSAQTLQHEIGTAWNALNRRLNRHKARRFTELTAEEMADIIGRGIGTSGLEQDVCAVCRRGITAGEPRRPVEGSPNRYRCGQCVSFEDLGNRLPRSHFLVVARTAPHESAEVVDWQQGLQQFGYHVQLLEGASHRAQAWSQPDAAQVRVYYWDDHFDLRLFPGQLDPARTIVSFRPLAQCVPYLDAQETEIATFDRLTSDGIPRWGVLRMDVDNLGLTFQQGIPANNLSRVVALSGLMRLFFEGAVPRIGQQINRTKQEPRLYLMYAGGDDLFVVGGWSDLPDLARQIQKQFEQFACRNPQVTLSGGISIALDGNYPLYQAARQAERAEEQAKQAGKNALSFLGEVIPWPQYERVHNEVMQVKGWLRSEGGQLPRSFLGTLRAIDAEWREWIKQERGQRAAMGVKPRYRHNNDLYLGPWQWHLVYSLSRAAERTRDKALQGAVRSFIQSILGGGIRTLGLVARWTEILTRDVEGNRHESRDATAMTE